MHYHLYVGDLSTAQGLALLDPSASVTITTFGATSFKHYGWATEKELPAFAIVQDLREFLEGEGADIGIIELEADIGDDCELRTHDDGECHFIFASKPALMATLKQVVPPAYEGLVIHALLQNPGLYVTCDEAGVLRKYATFDAYLEATD